jgi:hypothetical protein
MTSDLLHKRWKFRALSSDKCLFDQQRLHQRSSDGGSDIPLPIIMIGFKAFEKKFKKFESPAAAVKEGKAVDFEGTAGYCHVRDVTVVGRICRLLSVDGYEGCYVIQDALSRRLQLELAHHCLSDCLQPKNKTNLHGHTEDSALLKVNQNFNPFALQLLFCGGGITH